MFFLSPLRTYVLLTSVCLQPALWKPVVSPILLTIFFHIVTFLTKKWSTCPSLGLVTGRTTLIPSRMGESELHLLLPWTQTQCSPLARGIISVISSNYQRLSPLKLSCWLQILPFSTPCYRPTFFCLRHFAQEPPVATCQAAPPLVAQPLLLQPGTAGIQKEQNRVKRKRCMTNLI